VCETTLHAYFFPWSCSVVPGRVVLQQSGPRPLHHSDDVPVLRFPKCGCMEWGMILGLTAARRLLRNAGALACV
jgi:hypothetical protein